LVTQACTVESIRAEFPILNQPVRGHRLTYLDNAATSLKPQCVIDSVVDTLSHHSANIHRGVHWLSQRATDLYEGARDAVQRFIGAADRSEIVFVRGATEAINLVAHSWGARHVSVGDEIAITELEHHANIVPWQMLRDATGAVLKVIPIDDNGEVTLQAVESVLSSKTRLVALAHVSNALGTVLPVEAVVQRAHAVGAKVLIDGAQAVAHMSVDVQALGADFYVFSGHKLYGPDGIGVLYARRELLETMPPYQTGGDMIRRVTFEKTTFNELPHRFEAGTPSISGAIGLSSAIRFVQSVGFPWIAEHEQALLQETVQVLRRMPGVKIVGMPHRRSGVVSFTLDGVHPHDVGTILDSMGVAVRTGHHCAQPVMDRMGIPATARASFGVFNTLEEISILAAGIEKAREMFA
jgi:cysteine desulfurase / selenocysteine lyase